MDKNKKNKTSFININSEVANRYGEAVHEYGKAYTGYEWKNQVTGQTGFAKGFKQVAQSKINKKYEYQNLKQQSGFSAEIAVTAKVNAENIINKSSRRISRSNDVGRGNDMQVDIADINKMGDFIITNDGKIKNGVQLKFSGKYASQADIELSAKNNVKKMLPNGKWKQYKCDIAVPSEQYEPMKQFAKAESEKYHNWAERQRKQGNIAKADLFDKRAKEYDDCSRRIKDSGISSESAMFIRKHPKLYTAKKIGEIAHQAGINQAQASAVIGGTISATRGAYDVLSGKKTISEVTKDIAVASAYSAVNNYTVTASTVALTGIMRTSKNGMIKAISRTNTPALFIQSIAEVSKSVKKFICGEIDEKALVEELGEKGVGMVASSWGAAVGTAIMPGIGSVVGGTVGYMASSILYQGVMKVYEQEDLSQKRRKQVQLFVDVARKQMLDEQKNLAKQIHNKYTHREHIFRQSLQLIEQGDNINNFNMFLKGMEQITAEIGSSLQFKTFQEIDSFMRDSSRKLDF